MPDTEEAGLDRETVAIHLDHHDAACGVAVVPGATGLRGRTQALDLRHARASLSGVV